MSEIATAYVRLRPNTSGFKAEADAGIKGALLGVAKTAAGVLGGLAIAKFLFVDPIQAAGDFQKSLNVLQATANATDAQMKSVSATAIQLGADVRLPATSAKDATDAMLELAKAGFSVTASQRAARGVIELSTAAQIDNATAAQIAANAINAFGLKASESTRVADLLAGAANASSASMTDVAQSLQFAASVAHQARVPIEDVVTAIAEMANRGISGSVAGSALAQVLRSLQAPSKKGTAALHDLGISVFDAQGNFRGIRPLIDQFTKATENMTQKDRARAVQAIFGSRAQQAANIVLLGGVSAFDKLKTATTEQGAAQKLATAQTHGFSGAVSGLRSTVETLQIQIGLKLLPVLTSVTHSLTNNLPGAVNGAVSVIEQLGTAVGFVADHFNVIGPLVGGAVIAFTAYKAIVLTTTAVQTAYAAVAATVNTAQLLLTGGTSAVAAAQAAQAAGTTVLTAEQFAAIASTAGLAAAQDALAASAVAAGEGVAVLDTALLASPIGLLTLAIAGGAGLIFALSRLGGSTDSLAGPFGTASSAVDGLTISLRDEKGAVDALINDNINLRQGHLDIVTSTARLSAANADVAAKQKIVNQLQRDGQTGTKAYRDALAALTDSKHAETQASIDHDRAVAAERGNREQQIADLGKEKKATDDAAAAVAKFTGSAADLATKAQTAQDRLTEMGKRFPALAAQRAAQGVKDYATDTGKLSAKIDASIPKLVDTAKKADAVAASYKGSHTEAAQAARAYAANADNAVAAAKKLGRLESVASLLSAAWKTIVDLPTAAFFIKETTQLTTIETNRLRRMAGGPIPAGALSLTGEAGPELSVSSAGRQIISKSDTVGIFREIGDGLSAVARALADQAAKVAPAGPQVAIASMTVQSDDPRTWVKQLNKLTLDARR